MFGKFALAVVVLALPFAASAQTSTDCHSTAVGFTCDTSPSSSATFANGVSALANAIAARKQKKNIANQFVQALQSGECEVAQSLAAQYGDANDVAVAKKCVSGKVADQFVQALQSGDCEYARSLATQYGNANDVAAARQCVSPKVAEQARQQEAEKTWMQGIATAISEHRCDDAKELALGNGRLDVAEQAMRLCTPVVLAKP